MSAMQSFGLDTTFGKAIAARVLVNGALAGEIPGGDPHFQSLALQHDVLPGQNRVDILLAAAPSAPPEEAGLAEAYARYVLERDDVRDLGSRYEITTVTVDEGRWQATRGAEDLPHRIALTFAAPLALAPPVWAAATPVAPESARAPIAAELETLRGLLAARDFAGFQARMRVRNEDMARAYPLAADAAERARLDSAALDEALPEGPPRLAPIDPARLRLEALAGGRMIGCLLDDGLPALRCARPGAPPLYIRTTFAELGGRMVVVR